MDDFLISCFVKLTSALNGLPGFLVHAKTYKGFKNNRPVVIAGRVWIAIQCAKSLPSGTHMHSFWMIPDFSFYCVKLSCQLYAIQCVLSGLNQEIQIAKLHGFWTRNGGKNILSSQYTTKN
jgi:hypothetical protein